MDLEPRRKQTPKDARGAAPEAAPGPAPRPETRVAEAPQRPRQVCHACFTITFCGEVCS